MEKYDWEAKLPNPTYTEQATPDTTHFDSARFFPTEVKNYILETPASKLTYAGDFPLQYRVVFYCYEPSLPLETLRQQMVRVLWWLYTIQTYAKRSCSRLELVVYLTPLKKRLPFRYSVGGEGEEGDKAGRDSPHVVVLSASNCNTGFSTRCDFGNTIVVYRQEEWFKVFVHETFHYFGLDFAFEQPASVNAALKKMFCVNAELLLFEAYTEFWAEMVVMLLYGRIHRQPLSSVIERETHHSLQQAKKVLRCQGLTYATVLTPTCQERGQSYREETNVFAYYVIKTVFLYFHSDFVRWCHTNNRDLLQFEVANLPRLLEWLEAHSRDPALVAAMDSARLIGNDLRMTTINI